MNRTIAVHWNEDLGISTYPVDIQVYSTDRPSLLVDMLAALAAKNIAVTDLKVHLIQETMNDVIAATIYVPDARTLEDVFATLKGVKGIYDCKRIIH